jgi:outer membrane protein OmpA-like peptidoglycan-associated protein
MKYKAILASCILSLFVLHAHGQQSSTDSTSLIDIHVSQSLPTVNYRSHGSTMVNFVGTALLPRADGNAKIGSQGSSLRIQGDFKGLVPPSSFGNAYLVYVLWAITPDGRASNLGQLVVKDGKSKVDVTTKLQTFGMMVTAEPYFAVSFPSEKVVLANSTRNNTKGTISEVDANMALLQRGRYSDTNFAALDMNPKVPLDLYQARNAVRIAKLDQAGKYAPAAFAKAEQSLNQAESYQSRKQKNSVRAVARQAIQSAEDAREIAVKRRRDAQIASQQEASQAQAAQAEAQARLEAQQRAMAQQQSAIAQQQQALAEQQAAAAQASQQEAETRAQAAQNAAAQALQERQQLRARLLAQFNRVLPTTDTPQGLMVNMGDVLFAVGKSDLRPTAKEALAKLSGIVLSYPTLKLSVQGYTDSTGGQAFNQTLSEKRAESVRDYLVQQGLDAGSITATGFGDANPIGDNSTAAGRQQNRRVEIIVSGEVIGTKIGSAH